MSEGVTVVIPVGPEPQHQRWLSEAIQSVIDQTHLVDEILLIDDMADVMRGSVKFINGMATVDGNDDSIPELNIWESPWRLGVAHAFNFGVALARNELVFMLGSDDWLEPECIAECVKRWEENHRKDAYYYVGVHYTDGREDQTVPCGEAMVTKGLWKATGGFPLETTSGACDAGFMSILVTHMQKMLVAVADGKPLCNYRVHQETDTAGRGNWQGIILETRNRITLDWKPPAWGRME